MAKKKVLFVRALKGFPDSRLEKEVYSLSKFYDVSVLAWDRNRTFKTPIESWHEVFGKQIKYVHIGEQAPIGEGFRKLVIPELKYWTKLYRYLRKVVKTYDVIHACDFDTGFVASRVIRKHRCCFVYDIFDYYADAKKGPEIILNIIRKMENKVISKADLTIICSEKRKEQIQDAEINRLSIIHNTPMRMAIPSNNNCDVNSNVMVKLAYIGTLSKDRYLENIGNVVTARNDIEWHVGGWGVLENYFRTLSESNKNIIYHGEVSYEKALEIECNCDIMTALYDPSIKNHKYAAPNKFYEALSLGKPLIMMKDTGMDEYIRRFNLGVIIDGNCENWEYEFSKALDDIIANREKWPEMKNRCQNLYNQLFTWERMQDNLLHEYKGLLQ